MADLRTTFAGISSPNPFWLASAPPTNTATQVKRAFAAGWGGAVWKTIGNPIVNVSSRYGAIDIGGFRVAGLNNIELITDRPVDVNIAEMAEVKREYPNHAVIASLMVESKREVWHDIVRRVEDAGVDGLELNFGCPHGMSERGMGSAVGQVPDYTCQIVEWVKEVARTPVIVKLTPNITDVRYAARAAKKGGADAVSLINTINSITGVDLDSLTPRPDVNGSSSHGGYCGPAVKPIALHMVAEVARDEATRGIPISGIGGVQTWRDAAEFFLLGASTVQVCTAVMHYGYRIIEDLVDGLSNYLDEKGLASPSALVGRSVDRVKNWEQLDLGYKIVADIDYGKCINCQLCYTSCNDGAHQSIGLRPHNGSAPKPYIMDDKCVGCNMCALVCPVPGCIRMRQVETGEGFLNWPAYVAKYGPPKGKVY